MFRHSPFAGDGVLAIVAAGGSDGVAVGADACKHSSNEAPHGEEILKAAPRQLYGAVRAAGLA